jgi:hypothetical protein
VSNVSEKPKTRLDNILDRIKNHRVLVWVLMLGLGVTAMGQMAGSFGSILKFLRDFRTSPPAPALSTAPKPVPAGAGPVDPECRYLLFVPFVQIQSDSLMSKVGVENLVAVITLGTDGAEREATVFEKPSIIVMKNYDAKEYPLTVVFGKIAELRKTFNVVKAVAG